MRTLGYLFIFLCTLFNCNINKPKQFNDSSDVELSFVSSVKLSGHIKELLSKIILNNQIDSTCILLVYIDKISYKKTIISVIIGENVPLLSEHSLPFLQAKIKGVTAYIFTGIEKYVESIDSSNASFVYNKKIAEKCEYNVFQFIDSLGATKVIRENYYVPFNSLE